MLGLVMPPSYCVTLSKLPKLLSPLKASVLPSVTWAGSWVKQGTAPPLVPSTLAGAASPEGCLWPSTQLTQALPNGGSQVACLRVPRS